MPKKTQDMTIGETAYRITQLGAETGDLVVFKVGQAIAGTISEGASLLSMVQAVRLLSAADFRMTVKSLAESTKVGVKDVNGDGRLTFVSLWGLYDDHFAGNYTGLLLWLKAALELNFADFFVEAKRRIAESAEPKA